MIFGFNRTSPAKAHRDAQIDLHLGERRLEALKRREQRGDNVTVDRTLQEISVSLQRKDVERKAQPRRNWLGGSR